MTPVWSLRRCSTTAFHISKARFHVSPSTWNLGEMVGSTEFVWRWRVFVGTSLNHPFVEVIQCWGVGCCTTCFYIISSRIWKSIYAIHIYPPFSTYCLLWKQSLRIRIRNPTCWALAFLAFPVTFSTCNWCISYILGNLQHFISGAGRIHSWGFRHNQLGDESCQILATQLSGQRLHVSQFWRQMIISDSSSLFDDFTSTQMSFFYFSWWFSTPYFVTTRYLQYFLDILSIMPV